MTDAPERVNAIRGLVRERLAYGWVLRAWHGKVWWEVARKTRPAPGIRMADVYEWVKAGDIQSVPATFGEAFTSKEGPCPTV